MTLVVVVCLTLGAFNTASVLAVPASELLVPPGFHDVMQQAFRSAPRLAELELTLALAESAHRQDRASRYGLQSRIAAPVSLSNDGATGGAELRLNQGIGDARLEGAIGLGVHHGWEQGDELRAAPAGRFGLRYPLGQGPDVGSDTFDLTLAEAHWAFTQERRAWERSLLSAYETWLATLRSSEAAEQRVALEEERYRAVQVREEDGGTAVMAVHEAAQQLAAAADRYEEAQFESEIALRTLQRFVGANADFAADMPLTLADGESSRRMQFDAPGGAPQTLQGWTELAYSERGEIALAQARVDLAVQELARAQAQAGISGELMSDVAYRPKASGDWEFTWQAGAVWQLPLHDPAQHEAVVQAELNLAQAEGALQAAAEKVEDAVWESYRKVELASRRVERLEEQVDHAEYLLSLAQSRLHAGLTARETLLEAEWNLTTTTNALAEAVGDLGLAILGLWHAAGKDVAW